MGSSKLVYRGRIIKVYRQRQRLPNGCVTDLDVISHPGAVLVIPFLDKEHVVMLRQYRPVLKRFLYELPAGTRRVHESHIDCARREVAEETGYRARHMRRCGVLHPVPGYSTEEIVLFEAHGLAESRAAADSDEILERLVVDRKKVRSLFAKGRLSDAKTIAAFAFCGWL